MAVDDGCAAAQQRLQRLLLEVVVGFWQVEADPELRPLARGTVDTDFATHLLDQALGNYQPQPRATGLAGQRVVGLAEGLEQRAHLLR